MEEKKNPQKAVKVEVRPASNLLKIVLIVLIVLSMATLIALRWVHNGILTETDKLREEAAHIENENKELIEKTEAIGSVQSIKDIAKEELGLVDPNTILIDPHTETVSPATTLP